MNQEQRYLVDLLKAAVENVYQEERFLLTFSDGDRKGLEQAFAFRTGIHLNKLLQGTVYESLDLDSEYNKNHGGVKSSERFPDGMRPDLIVHERDSNDENKLVVEFKGYWNLNSARGLEEVAKDKRKLEDLTNANDNYGYLVGVFVIIQRNDPATFQYFENGQEINGQEA
ncbi:MAG: hypothetical protein KF762_17250 [Acidobacteria bacterium]|nr:hypothetical protein [Acidobacteriota bacterium]